MIACTETYGNSHWVLITDEGKIAGLLKAKPFETSYKRLVDALNGHYDDDVKIKTITELTDQIHQVTVFIPENEYNETIILTPSWEY